MKKLLTILAITGAFAVIAEEDVTTDVTTEVTPAEVTVAEETPVVEAADAEMTPVAEATEAEETETPAENAEAPAEETQSAEAETAETAETPAEEAKPAEAAPVAEMAPAEAAPVEDAKLRENGTDDIDIENDDSAEAAKNASITENARDSKFVDITCDEATLADILRQFRKTTNANIISSDSTNLQQRVSVNLVHVNWLRGLESILNTRGFRLDEREGIFRVVEDKQLIPTYTRTFLLNHASAGELADLFNKSYGYYDAKGKRVDVATAFPSANTVVISATEKQLAECEAIIRAVDKAVAQIYIEARFMELSSDAMHELGIQWDSLRKVGVSANNMSFSYQNNKGENVNGGEDWTTFGNKRVFTGTLKPTDFGLFMSAFEKTSGKQIFSNPKVIVSNGKDANIDMTTKYPNLSITSQRNTSTTTPYTDYTAKLEQINGDKPDPSKNIKGGLFAGSCFFEWGITLSVRPRISPDGLISVSITPSISQLNTDITDDGFYKVNGGSSAADDMDAAAYGKYPIIEVKKIETEFSMMDGSTAVIGGLSRTVEEDVDSGIPYLRKIPWIGQYLFGWKSRQKIQKEIIICVTLGIANPAELPEDIGLPTNAVFGREYISGVRKEPGFRDGKADDKVLTIDTTPIHERKVGKGKVRITPSKEQ